MTQSNGGGSSILDYASQFIGNPYVWGGTSLTGGADCSGFVKSVLAHFGIDVPHSSASIRGCGRQVSESEMQPGDIVCYSGHVGIYAGDGRLLSALGKKYGITYNSVHYKNILSVRRFT
jgi:cell wall-associated NlpC family hydrolase